MKEAKGRIQKSDRQIIQKMENVLEANGIPAYFYHVGGYAEECVCLERTVNGWEVYTGERGNRSDVMRYDNVFSACRRVLDKVAESDVQYQKLLRDYIYSFRVAPVNEIRKAVRKSPVAAHTAANALNVAAIKNPPTARFSAVAVKRKATKTG